MIWDDEPEFCIGDFVLDAEANYRFVVGWHPWAYSLLNPVDGYVSLLGQGWVRKAMREPTSQETAKFAEFMLTKEDPWH